MNIRRFSLIATALASFISVNAAPLTETLDANGSNDVIFNTFNTDQNDLYDDSEWYDVTALHSSYGFKASTAVPFVPERTSRIHRIEIALTYESGANEAELSVRNDAGGVPGDIITSWDVQDIPNYRDPCCEIVTVSPAGLLVNGGQTYWLVAKTKLGTDTVAGWYPNSISLQGMIGQRVSGSGWEQIGPTSLPACRISGWVSH